jgi:hypothetical protein
MSIINVEPNKGANMPDAPVPSVEPQKPGFIRDHFATLVIFAVFCLLLSVYLIELHWSGNDTVTSWLQNKMSDLIAAMLMGLTGAAIAAKKS